MTEYNNIWNQVKWMAILCVIAPIIALFMIILILIQGIRKTSRAFYITLYIICLIGMIIAIFCLWRLYFLVRNKYQPHHDVFSNGINNNCIVDKGWAGVLSSWYTHTSFGSLRRWLWWLGVIAIILFILALLVGIWALLQLRKQRNTAGYWETVPQDQYVEQQLINQPVSHVYEQPVSHVQPVHTSNVIHNPAPVHTTTTNVHAPIRTSGVLHNPLPVYTSGVHGGQTNLHRSGYNSGHVY